MNSQKVVVTGASFFLNRHRFLIEEIDALVGSVECIESYHKTVLENLDLWTNLIIYACNYLVTCPDHSWIIQRDWQQILREFKISRRAFITKSKRQERRILQMSTPPNWVIQIFSLAAPFWKSTDIPYAYYLDHTMALAQKSWTQWVSNSHRQYHEFLACEQLAYQQAAHLFCMSQMVQQSLVEDYGIPVDKTTVVGSGGNFKAPDTGEKTFGSKRIVLNGSDFYRKGGDIVLDAFKRVRQEIPEARLSIIGTTLNHPDPGVENPGYLDTSEAVAQMFFSADLVVAPARWDPFPGFIIEAMNYGVPCIVSANGGMREIVDHSINGIVLADCSPETLARTMIDLLNHPQRLQELSQNARRKVATSLNWHAVATKIVKTMNQLSTSYSATHAG